MSSTRLLVLGVVRIFQPVHGYDVRRELLSWRVDQWANVAPGSIYNALKTLTKEKFLKVTGTGQVGGRPERTQYSLTADGEREFQALLRATWWRVLPPLDDLMPALCFMPTLKQEELVAALEHRIASLEGAIKHLEFSRDEIKPPDHARARQGAVRPDAHAPGGRDPLGPDLDRPPGPGRLRARRPQAAATRATCARAAKSFGLTFLLKFE